MSDTITITTDHPRARAIRAAGLLYFGGHTHARLEPIQTPDGAPPAYLVDDPTDPTVEPVLFVGRAGHLSRPIN